MKRILSLFYKIKIIDNYLPTKPKPIDLSTVIIIYLKNQYINYNIISNKSNGVLALLMLLQYIKNTQINAISIFLKRRYPIYNFTINKSTIVLLLINFNKYINCTKCKYILYTKYCDICNKKYCNICLKKDICYPCYIYNFNIEKNTLNFNFLKFF